MHIKKNISLLFKKQTNIFGACKSAIYTNKYMIMSVFPKYLVTAANINPMTIGPAQIKIKPLISRPTNFSKAKIMPISSKYFTTATSVKKGPLNKIKTTKLVQKTKTNFMLSRSFGDEINNIFTLLLAIIGILILTLIHFVYLNCLKSQDNKDNKKNNT